MTQGAVCRFVRNVLTVISHQKKQTHFFFESCVIGETCRVWTSIRYKRDFLNVSSGLYQSDRRISKISSDYRPNPAFLLAAYGGLQDYMSSNPRCHCCHCWAKAACTGQFWVSASLVAHSLPAWPIYDSSLPPNLTAFGVKKGNVDILNVLIQFSYFLPQKQRWYNGTSEGSGRQFSTEVRGLF